MELLRALVPDTLRAKALNGATPAHDAAFQGHLKKRGDIGDSSYQETDVMYLGFCLGISYLCFLRMRIQHLRNVEHIQLLWIFTSPECLSRTARTQGHLAILELLHDFAPSTLLARSHVGRVRSGAQDGAKVKFFQATLIV